MTDVRFFGGVGPATRGRALALTQWRLRNFKSVAEADVDLAPLTVLVGANSSGKSSLIQSILAVTQAVRSRGTGGSFPLNGELVNLGSYRDALRMGTTGDPSLTIGGVLDRVGVPPIRSDRFAPMPTRTARVDWKVEMAGADDREPGSALIRSVQYDHDFVGGESLSWRLHRDQTEGATRRDRLGFAGPGAEGPVMELVGTLSWRASDEEQVAPIADDVQPAAVVLAAGLPLGAFVETGRHRELAERWCEMVHRSFFDDVPRSRLRELLHRRRGEQSQLFRDDRTLDLPADPVVPLRDPDDAQRQDLRDHLVAQCTEWVRATSRPDDRPAPIRAFLDDVLERFRPEEVLRAMANPSPLVEAVIRRIGEGDPTLVDPNPGTVEAIRTAGQDVLGFFRNNVRYLGPLRQDPQFTYRTAPSAESGQFGTKGEYTIALLHANAEQLVRAPLPDAPDNTNPVQLGTAVSRWLRHFDVGTDLKTRSAGRPGLEAQIRQQGLRDALPLTSVGVGVSQLLPVIVMALLSPPGSLLMFEQPELHLHPAPQQRLADFLVACARSGRRLIVETHSEYLVTRLRLLVAQDQTSHTKDLVSIVYAQRAEGVTTYASVEVNPYGGIDDWPAGFFDQAAADAAALLQSGIEKRRKELN